MLLIPYRRLRIHTHHADAEVTNALSELLDGSSAGSTRLRGTVGRDGVRLLVVPKPWHRIPYMPVATGQFLRPHGEMVLDLSFRAQLSEFLLIVAWSALVIGAGGPLLMAVAVPLAYHIVGCLVGFEPEVNRVAALLQSALNGRTGQT
jgi:hypothetical protein